MRELASVYLGEESASVYLEKEFMDLYLGEEYAGVHIFREIVHLIGERASETLSGVTNGNRGYIFI